MKYNIEAYINNEMTADERQSFEAELSSNAQLQAEVEDMRVLIRDLRRINISKQVGIAQKRLLARKKTFRIVSLGLLLILLLVFAWFLFQKNKPFEKLDLAPERSEQDLSPQKLQPKLEEKQKEDSLKASTAPPIVSVEKPSNESYFKQLAINAYEIPDDFLGVRGNSLDTLKDLFIQKKYDEGLFLLNQIATLNADQTYLYAHFLFKKGAFLKAQQRFYTMEMDPKMVPFIDDVRWFELLAAMTQGQKAKQEVQRLYQLIVNDTTHPKRTKVLDLNKDTEFHKLVQ